MNRRAVATRFLFFFPPQLRFACTCRSITRHYCVSVCYPCHNKTYLLTLWRNEFNRQPRTAASRPLARRFIFSPRHSAVLPRFLTMESSSRQRLLQKRNLISFWSFPASIFRENEPPHCDFSNEITGEELPLFFVICACQNH